MPVEAKHFSLLFSHVTTGILWQDGIGSLKKNEFPPAKEISFRSIFPFPCASQLVTFHILFIFDASFST